VIHFVEFLMKDAAFPLKLTKKREPFLQFCEARADLRSRIDALLRKILDVRSADERQKPLDRLVTNVDRPAV